MRSWVLAITAALVLHGLILLFGGVFFMKPEEEQTRNVEVVDLLTEEQAPEAEETLEEPPAEEVTVAEEPPPPAPETVDLTPRVEPTDLVARLDALSLGALESALDGEAAGESFGGQASLASGGRIGGTGAPGLQGGLDSAASDAIFDIGELDQRPRVLHQVPPTYPLDARRRKIEGTVYVVFVIERDGRVKDPVVESSPSASLQQAALEAVRRWRYEPAVVRGEKVRAKMRVPIRFSASS